MAILGSVLAATYSAQLGRAVDVLPPAARAEAGQSIVATFEAVRRVEADGDVEAASEAATVIGPAREAFVAAMHVTALGTAAASSIATVVVLIWLAGRRGRPVVTV